MADLHTVPPQDDPMRQKSASGNAGVYNHSEATDTSERTKKNHIGVYDRPERTFGAWSPLILIAIIFGALFLLWMLGMFDYFVG